MLILHAFTPGIRERDQVETWRALEEIRRRYDVVDVPTIGAGAAYSQAVASRWSAEDLVVCEQDVVPDLSMLGEFERCPELACVQAARIYPVSTGLDAPIFAQFVHWHGGRRPIEESETRADESGIALCRIRKELQEQISADDLLAETWYDAERRITAAFMKRSIRWCVHWPAVEHNHKGGWQEARPRAAQTTGSC